MTFTNVNYRGIGRNIVSTCCQKPIVTGTVTDKHPLGRGEYNGNGISYKVNICENCGEEADEMDVCEGCGEEVCEGSCCA